MRSMLRRRDILHGWEHDSVIRDIVLGIRMMFEI